MGDQNAPERWTIQGSYREYRNLQVRGRLLAACEAIEVVDAAAYDRVVAERDEAQAERAEMLAADGAEKGAARRTRDEIDRYREALKFYADEENYNEAGAAFRRFERVDRGWTARDALAEGEQPAGETAGEVVTDRMVREAEHSFRRASWHPSRDTIRDGLAAALAVRPAAGEQSTTETIKPPAWLRSVLPSSVRDGSPSTTEAATGDGAPTEERPEDTARRYAERLSVVEPELAIYRTAGHPVPTIDCVTTCEDGDTGFVPLRRDTVSSAKAMAMMIAAADRWDAPLCPTCLTTPRLYAGREDPECDERVIVLHHDDPAVEFRQWVFDDLPHRDACECPAAPATPEGRTVTVSADDVRLLALLDDGEHDPTDPRFEALSERGLVEFSARVEGWELTDSGRRVVDAAATPEGPDA